MSQTLTKKGVQITSPPVIKSTELVSKLVSAGLAACVAEAITLPMDTAKIKLQVRFSHSTCTMNTFMLPSFLFLQITTKPATMSLISGGRRYSYVDHANHSSSRRDERFLQRACTWTTPTVRFLYDQTGTLRHHQGFLHESKSLAGLDSWEDFIRTYLSYRDDARNVKKLNLNKHIYRTHLLMKDYR